MTLYLTAIAIAIVQGWLVTDPLGIASPIFNPIRTGLGKRSRQNQGRRPDDFDWAGFFAHKFVCRPCSGVEGPAIYALFVADGLSHGVSIWAVSFLANLAYNELLEKL